MSTLHSIPSARPASAQSLRKILVAEAASATFDYATSQRAYARGAVESNPVFGQARPSVGRMLAVGVPIDLAYELPGAWLARSEHPRWMRLAGRGLEWWPVAVHVEYGSQNLYYQSSTTSVAGGPIRGRFRP